MKRTVNLLLMCVMVVFVSCKKTKADTTGGNTYVIMVKEYKTNIPLPGVHISLYRCSSYDIEFGCQATSLFATYITDSKGEYKISQLDLNKADEGITLSRSQYWSRHGGTGEVAMEPEAWTNITIKASKDYPDTSLLQLKAIGEFGAASFETIKAPKDSMMKYRLFGNETNVIDWIVYTKDLSCIIYCVYDTLASGSLTLKPGKFESLASSLNY